MFKKNFPNLEIWSFEPNFNNFSLLKQNIKNLSNVNAFNFGIGSATGVVNFNKPQFNNYGAVSISPNGEDVNFVVKLDTIEFHNKKITFIKLDVEGHEYSVIEGMSNILINHSPVIWLEDYTKNSVRLLEDYGYSVIDFEMDANYLMVK
jgi:FkbM family methyltransferase